MKEHPLQQLWNSRRFEHQELQSLCGRRFRLLESGAWNSGDGPDFRYGRLQLSGETPALELRGDIELHVHEADWQKHGHSADAGYNAVILHVFLFPFAQPVRLQNGTQPLRLCLKPYLRPAELAPHVADERLACAPGISWISERVMAEQLERARREYFEAKTNALMQDWNPDVPITRAWRELLLLHLADGLGISRNRGAMRRLAQLCFPKLQQATDAEAIHAVLRRQSGLFEAKAPDGMKRSEWDFSGARPGNKPPERIRQLAHIWAALETLPRRDLLSAPDRAWEDITQKSGLSTTRRGLLYLTVWLPSAYLLGSILQAHALKSYAYERWIHHHYAPEKHLQKPFRAAGFPGKLVSAHLGTVHQLRSYCTPGKCEACKIGNRLEKLGDK